MLAIPLSRDAETILREVARKLGMTPEEFARRAILDRLEDAEDGLVAETRLDDPQEPVAWDSIKARVPGTASAK